MATYPSNFEQPTGTYYSAADLKRDLDAVVADKLSQSVVTTKGDLLVASGSGVIGRQAAGADGALLFFKSANANGVETRKAATTDLSDVAITSLASGQVLQWNGTKWANVNPATAPASTTEWAAGPFSYTGTVTTQNRIIQGGFPVPKTGGPLIGYATLATPDPANALTITITKNDSGTSTRTNVLQNANFEANVGNWASEKGSGTLAQDTLHPQAGTHSLKYTKNGTAGYDAIDSDAASTSAGAIWSGSAYVYSTAGRSLVIGMSWRTATTVASEFASTTATVTVPAATLTRISVANAAAPTGTTFVALGIGSAPGADWAAGEVLWMDAALLEQSATVGTWIDSGSTGAGGSTIGTLTIPAGSPSIAPVTFTGSTLTAWAGAGTGDVLNANVSIAGGATAAGLNLYMKVA